MSPTPDKTVLQAELHFNIDLPSDYATLSDDAQRALRSAFSERVAHHPDENDDEKGNRLCDVERGRDPASAGRQWIEGELITKRHYPSAEELSSFVKLRLDAYNSVFRAAPGQTQIDVAPGPDPSGPVSGPTGPGGGPRGVRYVIVCGKLRCIYALRLVQRSCSAAASADDAAFEVEVDLDGEACSLPIVAEISFGRPHT